MPNNAASPRLVVEKPGYGAGMYSGNDRLPTALDHSGLSDGWGMIKPITLRERTMLRFMNAVTDKPDWSTKVFDESIVEKWRLEAVKFNDENTERADRIPFNAEMTEAMFDYSVQELRYRAEKLDEDTARGAVYALPGEVYKSDSAVPDEVKRRFQEAVKALEDVPEDQKDWHPGSDSKVLDLVHPSLFPLVRNVSRILSVGAKTLTLEDCIERIGEGQVLTDRDGFVLKGYSERFQWLPCDVDISGEKPRIETYINNLHPRHYPELYAIIEEVIGASIPLWERTLALAHRDALFSAPRRVDYSECEYHDEEPEYNEDEDENDRWPQMEDHEDEAAYQVRYDAWEQERNERRRVILPEPAGEFDKEVIELESFTLKEKLGDRSLQVIVKLANIELTPEKPEYGGGSWHVEGMLNESICATAIYYFDTENLTESSLAFRQASYMFDYDDVSYEQEHHDWLHQVYGLKQHGNTVQHIGEVVTKEGRLLTFPNILQHQVQPFKLQDPTKPGHRKILALFLVDPTFSIVSTADVPPQQHAWWAEKTFGADWARSAPESMEKMKKLLETLPVELKDEVKENLKDDFPITMKQAKGYREELMEERKSFQLANQESFESVEISLCEH